MIKKAFTYIVALVALTSVVVWAMQFDTSDNKVAIDFIKSHMYNGRVVDSQNSISVRNGVKDIKWYYSKNNTLVIEYGKIKLKYKVKDFIKAERLEELNKILITVKQHPKTRKLTLFFQGDEIKEYVEK